MCQSTARVGVFAQLAQEHSAIFNKHKNNSVKQRNIYWKQINCMCIDQSILIAGEACDKINLVLFRLYLIILRNDQ